MELNKLAKILILLSILAPAALAQGPQSSTTTTQSASTASTTASTSLTSSRATTSSTSTRSTGVPPGLSSTTQDAAPTRTNEENLPPKPTLGNGYPPPAVPPLDGAPFMRKSNLPEGTFFIAVGAALGFLLFSVFAWRALVAWSLHRSVKRAAEQANKVDTKAPIRTAPNNNAANFYAAGAGSALSLGDLGGTRGGSKQTPNSSLFFSPTAGVSASGGDRRSAYLPSGYYAAGGNASGGLGGPMNNSQTHFHSQSVSSRYGYGGGSRGGVGPSPPGSPSMPPSRGGGNGSSGMQHPQLRASQSNTSLSLPPVAGQRAPSAYLEDLFDHQKPGRY